MLHAFFEKHPLKFKKPAGTSRGILLEKPTYFIYLNETENNITGKGECSLIPGLSIDDRPDFELILQDICEKISKENSLDIYNIPNEYPAIKFGIEMANLDLQNGGKGIYFDNEFSRGHKSIIINGLIWMGSEAEMWNQVRHKAELGFKVIKLKIGALDFEKEIKLLQRIRSEYGNTFEIRLDANGAFQVNEALQKLEKLAQFNIHSIEQPVKSSQWDSMAILCKSSPIPIALDEELIGIFSQEQKEALLNKILPQYIILKPSLLGGFKESDEWILIAEKLKIGWWATSALESNLGLAAISQWVGGKAISLPQGLGTGGLYTNNVESKLILQGENLSFSA